MRRVSLQVFDPAAPLVQADTKSKNAAEVDPPTSKQYEHVLFFLEKLFGEKAFTEALAKWEAFFRKADRGKPEVVTRAKILIQVIQPLLRHAAEVVKSVAAEVKDLLAKDCGKVEDIQAKRLYHLNLFEYAKYYLSRARKDVGGGATVVATMDEDEVLKQLGAADAEYALTSFALNVEIKQKFLQNFESMQKSLRGLEAAIVPWLTMKGKYNSTSTSSPTAAGSGSAPVAPGAQEGKAAVEAGEPTTSSAEDRTSIDLTAELQKQMDRQIAGDDQPEQAFIAAVEQLSDMVRAVDDFEHVLRGNEQMLALELNAQLVQNAMLRQRPSHFQTLTNAVNGVQNFKKVTEKYRSDVVSPGVLAGGDDRVLEKSCGPQVGGEGVAGDDNAFDKNHHALQAFTVLVPGTSPQFALIC